MNTLVAIAAGFAVIGLCYAVQMIFCAYLVYRNTRKPDNKDLFQK